MLASINPLGERGRKQRYGVTAGVHIASSMVAGAALGAALGLIGSRFTRPLVALPAIATLGVLGLGLDRRLWGSRVPGPRRQVDESWLSTYRGWVYGAGFGFQLGLGFTTIVSASATWLAFACALLSGSPLGGLTIGATYGLVRALPVLSTARIRDPASLRSWMSTLDRFRPHIAIATTLVQCTAILAALGLTGATGAT
jgi:hypothetical protein